MQPIITPAKPALIAKNNIRFCLDNKKIFYKTIINLLASNNIQDRQSSNYCFF